MTAAQRRVIQRAAAGHSPLARDWAPVGGGKGTCFHQALDTYVTLRRKGITHWRLTLGVVGANPWEPQRHVHCWFEEGAAVLSAVSGELFEREAFYSWCPIEPGTARWVNPRAIVRQYRGDWQRGAVTALLNLWGLPWHAGDEFGSGVLPAFPAAPGIEGKPCR